MKRADIAEMLAPPAPPCFESRMAWIGWVRSAAEVKQAPIDEEVLVGKPLRFNRDVSFCSDCMACYRARMIRERRCVPSALQQPQVEAA